MASTETSDKKENVNTEEEMAVEQKIDSDFDNGVSSKTCDPQQPNDDNVPKRKKSSDSTAMETEQDEVETAPCVSFKVHNGRKETFDMVMPSNQTVQQLKKNIHERLPESLSPLMKLICKGRQLQDELTLAESNITNGTKVLLMTSTVNQIVSANKKPSPEEIKASQTVVQKKEPLCKQKPHSTYIQMGVPDDAMPGIKGVQEPLPPIALKGMRNNKGRPLRLTFKLELDQLWIGTPERTTKIPMNQINDIVSEPIEGHEQYHVLGIKIGSTEASRIWAYWVPAQYVDAIKKTVMD